MIRVGRTWAVTLAVAACCALGSPAFATAENIMTLPLLNETELIEEDQGDPGDQQVPGDTTEGPQEGQDGSGATGVEEPGEEETPSEEPEQTYVAKIGETEYASLGEAIDAANGGADGVETTIELLANCTLDKTIEIQARKKVVIKSAEGNHLKITDSGRKGITLNENSELTVDGVHIETNGQIFLNGRYGKLEFKNLDLSMDGEMFVFNSLKPYYCCAIGLEQSFTKLSFDACAVTIKDYASSGSAIRWNGTTGDTGYAIQFVNGTKFDATNCYAGITGTCDVLVDASKLNVHGNRGNGSNGSNYIIKNVSDVTFSNNGSHGLSTANLTVDSSTVTASGNGICGVISTGTVEVNDSIVTIIGNEVACEVQSRWSRPGALCLKGSASFDADSIVTISGNRGSGIYLWNDAELDMACTATVTGNSAEKSGMGGGLYNEGICTLGSGVEIYNNHAEVGADDIFNADIEQEYDGNTGTYDPEPANATLEFNPVGAEWYLDGDPDCTDKIDGWYLDGAKANGDGTFELTPNENRWEAHANTIGGIYAEKYDPFAKDKGPLGHDYMAAVGMRTMQNSGCPYCAGKKVLAGFNDLATAHPKIAAQWHSGLNGQLTPQMVTAGSHKKVWWICAEGHVWKAVVYSRTGKQQRGCPVCAGTVNGKRRIRYENMLAEAKEVMQV